MWSSTVPLRGIRLHNTRAANEKFRGAAIDPAASLVASTTQAAHSS